MSLHTEMSDALSKGSMWEEVYDEAARALKALEKTLPAWNRLVRATRRTEHADVVANAGTQLRQIMQVADDIMYDADPDKHQFS